MKSAFFAAVIFGLMNAGCVAEVVDSSEFSVMREAVTGFHQVTGFGANPANIKMFEYVPSDIPAGPRPLVVALHGCQMTARGYQATGWSAVADELGLYVLYPQQTTANSQLSCFNWGGGWPGMPSAFVSDSTQIDFSYIERGQTENQSIIEMVNHMKSTYDIDENRVYITGVSGGGGMASLMLALWPDVFAGGSIIAGVPYLCASDQGTTGEAKACMGPLTGAKAYLNRTPQEWGDLARSGYPGWSGPWPLVSIWHGTSDSMVAMDVGRENIDQWTNVHGIDGTQPSTETLGRVTREDYTNGSEILVRYQSVSGMSHGVPVAPAQGCGSTGMWYHGVGACAAREDAHFWGLDGEPPIIETDGDADVDSDGDTDVDSDSDPTASAPLVNVLRPSDGDIVNGSIEISVHAVDLDHNVARVEVFIDDDLLEILTDRPFLAHWDSIVTGNGAHQIKAVAYDGAGNRSIDDDTSVVVDDGAPPYNNGDGDADTDSDVVGMMGGDPGSCDGCKMSGSRSQLGNAAIAVLFCVAMFMRLRRKS